MLFDSGRISRACHHTRPRSFAAALSAKFHIAEVNTRPVIFLATDASTALFDFAAAEKMIAMHDISMAFFHFQAALTLAQCITIITLGLCRYAFARVICQTAYHSVAVHMQAAGASASISLMRTSRQASFVLGAKISTGAALVRSISFIFDFSKA